MDSSIARRQKGIRFLPYVQSAREACRIRKTSITYSVPKSTLSEGLGDKRPSMPPLKGGEARYLATRHAWSEADMRKALAAIQQSTVSSISEAARQFSVPASSLNARERGRTPRNLKGELSRLILQQESLLADWAFA
ncbi:hypothetical protein HD806DRAFT_205219 [Xylariaceae sp. AK1471]|nr:hypothetical protein HD806DRAFT_205219 [Xylariaceae sp. AK1471]